MSAVNTKVSFNQLVFRTLYFTYKDFITPVAAIGVCVLLFMFFVIPQLQAFWANKDAIAADTQKLTVLRQNLQAISQMDDTQLDQYVSIATSALPPEKDFTSILQAITTSAVQAGVVLGDYNFQIGDLAGGDTKAGGLHLPLQLLVTVEGNIDEATRFVQQLHNQLPISDVLAVSANANNSVSLTLVFYYAPLPKITFNDGNPLPVLSAKDITLLQSLSSLESTNGVVVSASPSAFVTPTPKQQVTPILSISPTPTPVGTSSAAKK